MIKKIIKDIKQIINKDDSPKKEVLKKEKKEIKPKTTKEILREIKETHNSQLFLQLSEKAQSNVSIVDFVVKNLYKNSDFKNFDDKIKKNKLFVLRWIKYTGDSLIIRYCDENIKNDIEVAIYGISKDAFCWEYLGDKVKYKEHGFFLLYFALDKDCRVAEDVDEKSRIELRITEYQLSEHADRADNNEYIMWRNSKLVKGTLAKYDKDIFALHKIEEEKNKKNINELSMHKKIKNRAKQRSMK